MQELDKPKHTLIKDKLNIDAGNYVSALFLN